MLTAAREYRKFRRSNIDPETVDTYHIKNSQIINTILRKGDRKKVDGKHLKPRERIKIKYVLMPIIRAKKFSMDDYIKECQRSEERNGFRVLDTEKEIE